MKNFTKHLLLGIFSVCLVLALGLGLAACGGHTHVDEDGDKKCDICGDAMGQDPDPTPTPTPDPGKDPTDPETPGTQDEKIDYALTVQRSSGDPLADITVLATDEKGALAGYGVTDEYGVATMKMAPGTYKMDFARVPEGFLVEGPYTLTEAEPAKTIRLRTEVIAKTMPNGQRYTLGSVMYDFSFTDSQGYSSSLSRLLQTKKAVLLNFWGVNCTWCIREFPAMKSAYEQYEDDVAVVALSSYSGGESTEEVEEYRRANNLPFHMVGNDVPCTYALTSAFGVSGFPTSVLIDREGVVCFIAAGSGDEDGFLSLFEKYTAEPYVQDIVYPEEQQEQQRPNVAAPSSAEIEAAVNDTASGYLASYYFTPKGEEQAHEYNWPWVVGEEGGETCIHPANAGYNGSFAMLYSDVTVAEGQVIALDYKTSTEANADYLYVFIDSVQMFALSGLQSDWRTLYYVPLEAGTYRLCLAYVKDSSDKAGADTVYVKNIRFTTASEIHTPTELTYRCATGEIVNNRYSKYITPIYNAEDGYYHVGTANGPLVLANLMEPTPWSNNSAYSYVQNGGFLYDLDGNGNAEDLSERFVYFCQYANNARPYGFVGVTQEIKNYLDAFTDYYGEAHHENEWLELCSYVQRYGFGQDAGELLDPARGLTDYNAIPAVENTGTEQDPVGVNHVVIDRVVMPRGFWFKFVPETTGVYRIRSLGNYDTYGWVRDEKLNVIAESDEPDGSFDPSDIEGSDGNFSMTLFLEADKAYYVACAFFGITDLGEYDFIITNLGASGDFWQNASGGEYTWEILRDENGDPMLDTNGEVMLGDFILKGAIETMVEDGKYYEKRADGSRGSEIYVNLAAGTTAMFAENIFEQFINYTFYYCENCGYAVTGGTQAPELCPACGEVKKFTAHKAFELPTPERDADGKVVVQSFTVGDDVANVPIFKREGGKIVFEDMTETMKTYIAASKTDYPEGHYGYVAATTELVEILTRFILAGDFSFPSIDNAWLLLSCYYMHLG